MNAEKKNKSNPTWIKQHLDDHFVSRSIKDNYRSRAAYKLLQLDDEYKIFINANLIIDLGCAPGSWSQVAINRTKINSRIIGVDLIEIAPLDRLEFIHGDFCSDDILKKLDNMLQNDLVDVILSDMSPNLTGIKMVDQARSLEIIEMVIEFIQSKLKNNGICIIKVFHGSEFATILKKLRLLFKTVIVSKPDASRQKSKETYLFCKDLR